MEDNSMKSYQVRNVFVLFTVILSGLITHAGFCCGTNPTMGGNQMEQNGVEVSSQLSLDTLEGSDWLLTHMNDNQALAEDVEFTLSFLRARGHK